MDTSNLDAVHPTLLTSSPLNSTTAHSLLTKSNKSQRVSPQVGSTSTQMPVQRRLRHKGAVASLPDKRLPVGTPHIPKDRSNSSLHSPTESRLPNRSASAASSHALGDTDIGSTDHHTSSFSNSSNMAAPTPTALSLAEARLRRQTERIQLAEAALTQPIPSDRARPISRAKGKPASQKLDQSNNSSRERDPSDGGLSVSEVRINTYHTSHDGAIPQRPYSSLSQHTTSTTTTGPSGVERPESTVIDDAGFQTIPRRGGRRVASELGAYEEKPEEKQTTVEATVDQREILKVFANVLPGIDFLLSYVECREGQVQFIQHPNGDVSAHMWCMTSNQWDNLGGFSNIRKKIEGQLAGDNLKGETAYQKMQQNTLAYFRTIAKQREATVGGVDFGQAEIQQLLPEPAKKPSPVIVNKERTHVSPPPVKLPSRVQASAPAFQPGATTFGTSEYQQPHGQTKPPNMESFYPRTATQAAVTSNTPDYSSHYKPSAVTKPDMSAYYPVAAPRLAAKTADPVAPDYSSYYNPSASVNVGAYDDAAYPKSQTIDRTTPYISYYSGGARYADMYAKSGPEYRGGTVAGPPKQGRQSISQLMPTYTPDRNSAQPHYQTFSFEDAPPFKPLPTHRTYAVEDSPSSSNRPGVLPYQHQPTRVPGTGALVERRNLSIASSDGSVLNPISKHREALRENLFKISDHAVERSQSRENIATMGHTARGSRGRSVLYDPFRVVDSNDCQVYTPPRAAQTYGKAVQLDSILSRHRPAATPPQKAPFSAHVPIGWVDSQLTTQPTSEMDDILADSTPDYDEPVPSTLDRRLPAPSYGFNSDPRACWPSANPAINMTPDEELRDWWTSGNKFARQESYFQSIMALSTAPSPSPNVAEKEKLYRIANPSQPSPSSTRHVSTNNASPTSTTTPPAVPSTKDNFLSRLLIPVYENLLSYVDGPPERRRDYWCRWSEPPEWAIDGSGEGGNSFYDSQWTTPGKKVDTDERRNSRDGGVAIPLGASMR
jgi:hypothetical protein